MGGACGKPRKLVYRSGLSAGEFYTEKLEPELKEIYAVFGLTDGQGRRFFDYFVEVDDDGGGTVDQDEFHEYFSLEQTPFSERAYAALDLDNTGELYFAQFLIGVWNLCSLDFRGLCAYIFNIFDVDQSGELDVAEVDALCRMLYNREENTDEIAGIIRAIDSDGDGNVTIDELVAYTEKFPALLEPAFTLQTKLRKALFGKGFWKRVAKKRLKLHGPTKSVQEILLTFRKEQSAKRKAREREEKREAEEIAAKNAEKEEKQRHEEAAKLKREEDKRREKESATQTALRHAKENFDAAQETFRKLSSEKSARLAGDLVTPIALEDDFEFKESLSEAVRAVRSTGNQYMIADVENFDNLRKEAKKTLRITVDGNVSAFLKTVDGKKLMKIMADDELAQMGSGGIAAARQARASEAAREKYLGRKVREEMKKLDADYDTRAENLRKKHFVLKDTVVEELGLEKEAQELWAWVMKFDADSKASYYECAATGGSMWTVPVNNVTNLCAKCQRKLCATIRCVECGCEMCAECEPSVHFGQKAHHERYAIPDVELHWRKNKRKFDSKYRKSQKLPSIPNFFVEIEA